MVRYKQSVIQNESSENLLKQYPPNIFTQWVADNVDHNVATLDGQGTFHGIAISTATDNRPLKIQSQVIGTNVNMLVKGKGVPIVKYRFF